MSVVGNHLKALKRRLAFLEARLAAKQHSEASAAYLRAERSALAWAINILCAVSTTKKPDNEATH